MNLRGYDNINIFLICVYMTCDDNRPNQNIIDYKGVLNDIIPLCNGADSH